MTVANDSPVWTKVTALLAGEPEDWSVWAEVFECHGISGTVQTDEPPTMSAYLAPGAEAGLPALRADLLTKGALAVETESIPEQDWAESWKQFFKPREIGRFVVRPTWEEFEVGPGRLEIVLDPGQAFGTGDHPTTRMCLELLDEAMTVAGVVDVADIGCGSGILSVAAKKLGAANVLGVDSDPLSVESTLENAALNGVEVAARVGKGFDPVQEGEVFDIVLSNIISAALIALAPEASRRVKQGGRWIVSGIITANWNDVRMAAERHGFRLIAECTEGEWVAATFVR